MPRTPHGWSTGVPETVYLAQLCSKCNTVVSCNTHRRQNVHRPCSCGNLTKGMSYEQAGIRGRRFVRGRPCRYGCGNLLFFDGSHIPSCNGGVHHPAPYYVLKPTSRA